ncbi:hypothetical protein PC39_05740 [Salinisphaera sp. PC39]|uniref:hypothetical protein n=1 Tax=Salinisphaera sp. PC39 TaxID=1304156 RepID=UPI00333F8B86
MIPAEYLPRSEPQGLAGDTAGTARLALLAAADATPDAGAALAALGYAVHPVADIGEIDALRPDLVLLHSDLATVPTIAGLPPTIPVVLYGGDPDVAEVVAWMRAGAADYLETTVGRGEWHRRLRRAMTGRRSRHT